MDTNVQYGGFDNRVRGIGLEPEQYDSRMARASLEAGYTFNVWQGASSQLYLQPQLSYVDFDADRHGTQLHGDRSWHVPGGNWLRGSGTSALQFNGDTLGADVPRNRYEMQAGAELKLGQRWGAWGGLTVQRGDHGYRNVGGQVGLRMVW
uniref:Autotransporter domain-containing protein n=1 Tax=Knufia peltigerae TaxID=1002370 RepID=A0AA39CWH3_9EURO|nr:hypothetical protein H2204_007743 [Knufia peltigerae]